jgi:hypothetical protein
MNITSASELRADLPSAMKSGWAITTYEDADENGNEENTVVRISSDVVSFLLPLLKAGDKDASYRMSAYQLHEALIKHERFRQKWDTRLHLSVVKIKAFVQKFLNKKASLKRDVLVDDLLSVDLEAVRAASAVVLSEAEAKAAEEDDGGEAHAAVEELVDSYRALWRELEEMEVLTTDGAELSSSGTSHFDWLSQFKNGDRIIGKYGKRYWYHGTIMSVQKDGVKVLFDDNFFKNGQTQTSIADSRRITRIPASMNTEFEVGDRVLAMHRGMKSYGYLKNDDEAQEWDKGKITEVHKTRGSGGTMYEVTFDDNVVTTMYCDYILHSDSRETACQSMQH